MELASYLFVCNIFILVHLITMTVLTDIYLSFFSPNRKIMELCLKFCYELLLHAFLFIRLIN